MNTPPVEIIFDKKSLPIVGGVNVAYKWGWRGVTSLRDGEIVFSDSTIANAPLYSRDFRTCFGIAGITAESKRVLAHICPGWYYPTTTKRFSSVYLHAEQVGIEDALRRWRDMWVTNANSGIFWSCIFPDSKQEGSAAYLESVRWLADKMAKIFDGAPQILWLPSKWYTSQDISITDRIIIARTPSFIPSTVKKTHIPPSDISAITGAMMK
jgi:hypothetical protein